MVSRTSLFPDKWEDSRILYQKSWTRWKLEDLANSDYGVAEENGTYDVDDHADIEFVLHGTKINIHASWRNLQENKRQIIMHMQDDTSLVFDFGLCPEYAYRNMITECHASIDNKEFWDENLKRDLWIHKILERFDNE